MAEFGDTQVLMLINEMERLSKKVKLLHNPNVTSLDCQKLVMELQDLLFKCEDNYRLIKGIHKRKNFDLCQDISKIIDKVVQIQRNKEDVENEERHSHRRRLPLRQQPSPKPKSVRRSPSPKPKSVRRSPSPKPKSVRRSPSPKPKSVRRSPSLSPNRQRSQYVNRSPLRSSPVLSQSAQPKPRRRPLRQSILKRSRSHSRSRRRSRR